MMKKLFADRYKIHSLRLPEWDYSEPGSYFITLCTQGQKSYFGEVIDGEMKLNKIGEITQNIREEIPKHFSHIELDICMIMPNHVHGIITINENHRRDNSGIISQQDISGNVSTHKYISRRNMLLPKIIGKFKMQTAKQINQIQGTKGKFRQPNYYEHVIRNEKDFERIHTYISNNPLKRRNNEYYI